MKKNIIFIILLSTFLFFSCTPDYEKIIVPPVVVADSVLSVRLWTMAEDTFFITDSVPELYLYADVEFNERIIADSTKVKFYCDFGQITASSLIDKGQAASTYIPLSKGGTTITGEVKIKASCALKNIIYDSLYINVVDRRTNLLK